MAEGVLFSQECIKLAHLLADAAAKITSKYFRSSSLSVEMKVDETPVTLADKETEKVLRELINKHFPCHGIIGEELGNENLDAEYVWVLDPIDGTLSFVNGVPLFTTLIGVLQNGKPWLGLIDQPILKDRWVGGAGIATQYNGNPCRVRNCSNINNASVYVTAPDFFTADELLRINRLSAEVSSLRFGGTDCYHYGMLSSGWIDVVCEKLNVYEFGAMVPVIEGAGGVMTDWRGRALQGYETSQVLASGDQIVHGECIKIIHPN